MNQPRDSRSEDNLLDLEDLVAGFGDDFSDAPQEEPEADFLSAPAPAPRFQTTAEPEEAPLEQEEIEFSLETEVEIEVEIDPGQALTRSAAPEPTPVEEASVPALAETENLPPFSEEPRQTPDEPAPEGLLVEMDDEEPAPSPVFSDSLRNIEPQPPEASPSPDTLSDAPRDSTDDEVIELQPAAASETRPEPTPESEPEPQPDFSTIAVKQEAATTDQEDAILSDVVLCDPPPPEPAATDPIFTTPRTAPAEIQAVAAPAPASAEEAPVAPIIRTLEPAPAKEPEQVKFEQGESLREDPSVSGQAYGKGLDIGTANLLAGMQDENGRTIIKKQRNAFVDIPADSHQKAMLTRLKVPYVVQGKQLYVLGDAAFELANVLNKNTRRPMQAGLLSPKESAAVPVMKLLIENLIGPPRKPGEAIFYSVPGEPIDSDLNVTYHKDIFKALLEEMGYSAQDINEGHSVVISELGDDDFTGIGISCGGGMANACVSYRSLPALTFAVSRGGDWIDNNVANVLGIKPAKATLIKESGMDVNAPKNREEEAVSIYMRAMITHVLTQIKERFEMSENMPSFPDPIPVVFAGGTPMIKGFADLVRQEFDKLDFPIPVKDVRIADDPLHAIARGCLLMALSE